MKRQHLSRDTEQVDLPGHRLRSWHSVQNLILKRVSAGSSQMALKADHNGSLEQNFSVAAALHHAEPLCSEEQLFVPGGIIFLTHSSSDLRSVITAWLLDDDFQICKKAFPTTSKLTALKYLPKHRKLIGCTADMKLKLFSDITQNCKELCQERLTSLALCIERIPDTEEIIVGGAGFLLNLMVVDDSFREGRPLNLVLRQTDVAIKLMVDSANKQLLVLCQHSVFLLHYLKNVLTHRFENKHESAMTCCAFYKPLNYFVTASKDGALKIWSSATYKHIREITAHSKAITDILPHSSEPLLFSGSLDGLIKIWRMDSCELHFKFDAGDAILSMKTFGNNYIYTSGHHQIKIYEYRMHHNYYATTHAQMSRLDRVGTSHFPAVILCRAQNGSIFVLNALTGKCKTSITAVKMLEDCKGAIYLRSEEQLFVLMDNDNVVVLDAAKHPCAGSYVIESGKEPKEHILSIAHIQRNRAVTNDNGSQQDDLIFAGLQSGEILLLHASRSKMAGVCRGHRVPVVMLQSSETWRSAHGNKDSIGYCDRLMSVSTDGVLKIWALMEAELGSETFTLVCLRMVDLAGPVLTLCMIRGMLAYVTKEDSVSLKIASLDISSQDQQKLRAWEASHASPPAKRFPRAISDLAGSARLCIFCTACTDGSLWVWDDHGTLLRRLQLDETLRGCCFADNKGTILIGIKNHLSTVGIVEYYPVEKLKQVLLEDFEDDEDEDSKEIDVSNTTPLDVSTLRRHTIDRQMLNLPINEDSTHESASDVELPAENQTQNKKQKVWKKVLLVQKLKKGFSSKFGLRTGSAQEPEKDKVESSSGLSKKGQESILSTANKKHVFSKAEFDAAVKSLQVTKEQHVKEEKRRASQELIKKMEEQKRKKYWPIAPDAIIPNSVVRGILEQTAAMLPESERSKLGEMSFMMAKLNLLNLKGVDRSTLESQANQAKKTSRKLIPEKFHTGSTQKELTLLSVEYHHAAVTAMQWDAASQLKTADLVPIAFNDGAFIDISITETTTPNVNDDLPVQTEQNDTRERSMWSPEQPDPPTRALKDAASNAFAGTNQTASESGAAGTRTIDEPLRAATPEQSESHRPQFQERKYKARLVEYRRRNEESTAFQPMTTRSVPIAIVDEVAPAVGPERGSASAEEFAAAAADPLSRTPAATMDGLLSIKNTRMKQRADKKVEDLASRRQNAKVAKDSKTDSKQRKSADARWQTWRQQESANDRPQSTASMLIDGGSKVILLKKRVPRPPYRAWERGRQQALAEASSKAQTATKATENSQRQDIEPIPVLLPGLYPAFRDEVGVYEDSMLFPPIHFTSVAEPSVDFQGAEQSLPELEESEGDLLPLDPRKVFVKDIFDESERYVKDYLRATWSGSPAASEARFTFPAIASTPGPDGLSPIAPPAGASVGPGPDGAQDSLWAAVPKLLAGEDVDPAALKRIHSDYCSYYQMARKKFQRYLSIYKTQHNMEVVKRMCLSRRDYRRRLFSP